MSREEIEFAASEYAISFYEKTKHNLSIHKMLCDAFIAGTKFS